MTTVLTIYSFGLRGNSAYKSIRKHRFWTQKPRKAPEIKEKIGADLFGSKMLQVRVLSLRPKTQGLAICRPLCFSSKLTDSVLSFARANDKVGGRVR